MDKAFFGKVKGQFKHPWAEGFGGLEWMDGRLRPAFSSTPSWRLLINRYLGNPIPQEPISTRILFFPFYIYLKLFNNVLIQKWAICTKSNDFTLLQGHSHNFSTTYQQKFVERLTQSVRPFLLEDFPDSLSDLIFSFSQFHSNNPHSDASNGLPPSS